MFLKITIAAFTGISLAFGSFHTVWRLQSSNYTLRDFFSVSYKYYALCIILGGVALAIWILNLEVMLLELSLAIVFLALSITITHKPPLKFTHRIKRLFCVAIIVFVAATFFLPVWVCMIFAHLVMFIAFMMTLPFETLNNRRYLSKCAEILEKTNAVKIAITGSYGKTSVKNILATLLKEKFCVAVASESVNTPLGISKFVNEGGINGAEVVVFEFGARRLGDINELCRLVKPNIGIITGLAPQHLQTFKTFENVVKTKTELLRYLKSNEFCVINAGDKILSAQKADCEILTAGEGGFVTAQNLRVNCNGSEFDLKFGENVVSNCKTKLLGRHNVTNICLAAACAYRLGVESEKIQIAIGKINPAPHRLEILPSKSGIIIDDSYNANKSGISAAAEVLKIFNQTKIVITQGIVEGGKKTKELNNDAGKILGEVVDKAVVTGKNAKYLAQGLLQGGLNKENILFASCVSDGVNLIKNELYESVLLFQNDLPQ